MLGIKEGANVGVAGVLALSSLRSNALAKNISSLSFRCSVFFSSKSVVCVAKRSGDKDMAADLANLAGQKLHAFGHASRIT